MEFKEFYEVIPNLPGVRVFQITDNIKDAIDLIDYIKDKDIELHIVTFDENIFEKLKNFKNININIRVIKEDQKRYNQRSIHYDTIFINLDIYSLKDREEFLRKIYRISKNGANIIFKNRDFKKEEIENLLQICNYVAINSTKLDDSDRVFVAKKMHGWEKV